jgi:SAF domain
VKTRERTDTTPATVERPAEAASRGRAGSVSGDGQGMVPTPPKARRRWGLFAAMAALICLGALGNVWLHQATTDAQQVVAARSTIERGAVITREELMTVQIGGDPALRTVPGARLESLVGKRAAVDVAAGSLLTGESVTGENVPGQGYSLVGVGVTPAMMPGGDLAAGDRVRIVATPGQQGEVTPDAGMVSVAADVVSTQTGTDTTGQGAQTIITVRVPMGDAARLAAMAATGKVAVVLDSRDR